MNIIWHGQTCFKIIAQKNKDGPVSILIDPFGKDTGLRPARVEADIILFTAGGREAVSESGFSIVGPGEYEIKGVYIQGIPVSDNGNSGEKTIYFIEAEDIKICHLGAIPQLELNSKELEKIGDTDILMIPVGGEDSLDAKAALKIMAQVEPKITIPMYYKIPGLKPKLESLEKFLKSLGIKKLEPLEKLSIKKKELPEEEARIVVLKP